jgi:hypothetical protein
VSRKNMVKDRGRPLRRLVAYARPDLSIPSVASTF